jgi:hypothetical protein
MPASGGFEHAPLPKKPGAERARDELRPAVGEGNYDMQRHGSPKFGALLPLITLVALTAAGAADPRDAGPRALIVTYHTTPANRVAFRRELEASAAQQWRRWKDEGVLQDYRLVYNRYVDSANWDAMALLSFAGEAGIERWKRIEIDSPAGLSPKALELATAIDTVPADLMRQNGKSAGDSVFLVIPYEYLLPVNEYLQYLDDYTLPQLDGWMQEGVLAHYDIYLARYPAGRPWQALLVLEYKGDRGLAARDATVAKVRGKLKDNPKWKAISDTKRNVRNERQPVIADPLAAS